MTRRLAATVTALVLAALLAGCSNDSADPVTISASASSAAPTPSVAAVSTTISTSTVPPTSDTVTAASSDGSSPPPWPSTLAADEVAAAQSAITSYRSYWRTMTEPSHNRATTGPTRSRWTRQAPRKPVRWRL